MLGCQNVEFNALRETESVTKNTAPPISLPPLANAKPVDVEGLFQLHRLCLRIFGLMTHDLDQQVATLMGAGSNAVRRKARATLEKTLREELPVLLLIHAADRLTTDSRMVKQDLAPLAYGLLLPCFSICYNNFYGDPSDPLKHVLAKLDWYLDGDKGDSLGAFTRLTTTLLGDDLRDPDPLLGYLEHELLPEMDRRYELAFRYEFA